MRIKLNGVYTTRDGLKVTINQHNAGQLYPYVGDNDITYTKGGYRFAFDRKDDRDLVSDYNEKTPIIKNDADSDTAKVVEGRAVSKIEYKEYKLSANFDDEESLSHAIENDNSIYFTLPSGDSFEISSIKSLELTVKAGTKILEKCKELKLDW